MYKMSADLFIRHAMRFFGKGFLRFDKSSLAQIPKLRNSSIPRAMYVHIPFCSELCVYCSFHRIEFDMSVAKTYFAALKQEIAMYKALGYNFEACYIGGGTPTILMPELLDTIRLIKSLFDVMEISCETNPNHLESEHLLPLRDLGVNRLSVGVQTFDDRILRAMGRFGKYGSSSEIMTRVAKVRDYFPTFNIDMMYNMPMQTAESLKRDLDIIRDLGISQVTFYPLMISASTKKDVSRTLGSVNARRGRALYELIATTLDPEFSPVTAWCFSRRGQAHLSDEYVVNYGEYAGVGSGAIGYLEGCIYANTFDICEYVQRVSSQESAVSATRNGSVRGQLLYDFLMQLFGLRLDLAALSKKHGVNAGLWLWPVICFFWLAGGIKRGEEKGILELRDRYYWVILMSEFFSSVNNFRREMRLR